MSKSMKVVVHLTIPDMTDPQIVAATVLDIISNTPYEPNLIEQVMGVGPFTEVREDFLLNGHEISAQLTRLIDGAELRLSEKDNTKLRKARKVLNRAQLDKDHHDYRRY